MIWIALVGATVLLGALLVATVKNYERQSASAAMEQVEVLAAMVDQLESRIENLETIASSEHRMKLEEHRSENADQQTPRIRTRT